jgi:ribosomal protein S18 acetylase RimI-like enzyme
VIHRDDWLSAIFGHPVFAVEASDSAPVTSVSAHMTSQARAMYFARVDIERVSRVRELSAIGFAVVDTTLTFERAVGREEDAAPGGIAVRSHLPADESALLAVAGSSFRWSRFHLDPAIPRAIADAVKRQWIASYLAGRRGDRLWVATVDDVPVGFNAVLASVEDGRRLAVIDLIATAISHRSRGVARALIGHFFATYAERAEAFRVGTQAANVPSVRLYEDLGFRLFRAAHVLHLHVRDGTQVPLSDGSAS